MEKALYRIIDANFNRSREGFRVVEEYCRFALNNPQLSGRAKQLRHDLCRLIDQLDRGKLIASRNTLEDVGVNLEIENQLTRQNLTDIYIAAIKRLPEALRAIAESVKAVTPEIAPHIEQIRYDCYTLEKDISIFADTRQKFIKVRLYILITSDLPSEIISMAQNLAKNGADCIQMRTKEMPDDQRFAVAKEFANICKDNGVLSIINDRADIAIASGADGVHLGQNDLPVDQVIRLQNRPMIIGKSTHSIEQLDQACKEQITYAALGPVFPTGSKPSAQPVGLEYVQKAIAKLQETGIGHVAIGGIDASNYRQLIDSGIQTVAMCSAITGSNDPAGACRAFKDLLPKASD